MKASSYFSPNALSLVDLSPWPDATQISGLQPCRSAQCCYQSRHY